MTVPDPILYKRETNDIIHTIRAKLAAYARSERRSPDPGSGWPLADLFGHMVTVILNRLNQVPEQHFRGFLNEAEIEPLPARPAHAVLTFTPNENGPASILVPAGTQVVTRPTEIRPEIVFETEQVLTAIPSELCKCVVVDALNYSERTALANGEAQGSFAAFAGEVERERILFIGDDLLWFADETSREHATVTLEFRIAEQEQTDANRSMRWCFFDGETLVSLTDSGSLLDDGTENLTTDGPVHIQQLPDIPLASVNADEARWLACKLTAGKTRQSLPIIERLDIRRSITILEPQPVVPNSLIAATRAGTVFDPLDPGSNFFPFGQQPTELDAFYLRIDEAFMKPGATVSMQWRMEELPGDLEDMSELTQLCVEWEYYSSLPDCSDWVTLGKSYLGCPELVRMNLDAVSAAKPKLKTRPLTRGKYLECILRPEITKLPESLAQFEVLTDIYTDERYIEIPLPDACTKLPDHVLVDSCCSSTHLQFRDTTCAFTMSGFVEFSVPEEEGDDPPFAETDVNEERGYWIRARLVEGSYNAPQRAPQNLLAKLVMSDPIWLPPEVYPPSVLQLSITYNNYQREDPQRAVRYCHSRTDQHWQDHTAAVTYHVPFSPFTAAIEQQALYLGFASFESSEPRPALPPGKWLSLQIDLDEESFIPTEPQRLHWQFRSDDRWRDLAVIDGTMGFARSGYVGFMAPENHEESTEFGVNAYWLRVLPKGEQSGDEAGSDNNNNAIDDASMPLMDTLRLNSVPACNAELIETEILGSSNGRANQRFNISRAPVLPGIQLEVLEPELIAERANQSQVASETTGTVVGTERELVDHAGWTRWETVSTFYGCGPEDRCFRLDPIRGEVLFGDDRHGRIPPPGSNNIRVRRYHTHSGATGNLPAETITELRNPSGDLGQIRRVANLVPSGGGLDAESVEETKRRGPQSLKHRQRPVTSQDFQWIALETDRIDRAYCLPTRDDQNHHQPGWVTLIVIPDSDDEKPVPSLALQRQIRSALEELALVNLRWFEVAEVGDDEAIQLIDTDQVRVTGAQFVEVAVQTNVFAVTQEDADATRNDILQRLDAFLHPLTGGPKHEGWIPGRDVYISEIATEIENVAGVDHVEGLCLSVSSMQQFRLDFDDAGEAPYRFPSGSQVSTFDERVKMILAQEQPKDVQFTSLVVFGLKGGDRVNLLAKNGELLETGQTIGSVRTDGLTVIFAQPIAEPYEWGQAAAQIVSSDGRMRQSIAQCLFDYGEEGGTRMTGAVLHNFNPEDPVSVVHRDFRRQRTDFLQIAEISLDVCLERVFVPDDHLVCAGPHVISMVLEPQHADSTT